MEKLRVINIWSQKEIPHILPKAYKLKINEVLFIEKNHSLIFYPRITGLVLKKKFN